MNNITELTWQTMPSRTILFLNASVAEQFESRSWNDPTSLLRIAIRRAENGIEPFILGCKLKSKQTNVICERRPAACRDFNGAGDLLPSVKNSGNYCCYTMHFIVYDMVVFFILVAK
jgi:hypothetical protein